MHTKYRKDLVKNFPLKSDSDYNQDILDELEYDKEVKREAKEQHKIKA